MYIYITSSFVSHVNIFLYLTRITKHFKINLIFFVQSSDICLCALAEIFSWQTFRSQFCILFIFIQLSFHDFVEILLVLFEIKFIKYPVQIAVYRLKLQNCRVGYIARYAGLKQQALRSSCELLRTKDSKIFKKEHSGTFRNQKKIFKKSKRFKKIQKDFKKVVL